MPATPMLSPPPDLSAALACHRCGYDVRAQPADGDCPECDASVAESRRMAAIPSRPAWRDSDPRWRRRVLAGVWVLACVPLMAALERSGWAQRVPVPTFFNVQGHQTLEQSLIGLLYVYLTFCIGVVLLFSRERGRRPAPRLDWTRRWGVITSYLVLLLGIPDIAFVMSLVLAGIASMFQALPPPYQPAVTATLVTVSTGYLRYGPHPGAVLDIALPACSSIVMLLACVPLFNALRSSGLRWLAVTLLAPLALVALMHLVLIALNLLDPTRIGDRLYTRSFYFYPRLLAEGVQDLIGGSSVRFSRVLGRSESMFEFVVEAAKWLTCLAIALWLSVAQVRAMCRRGDARSVPDVS